MAKQGCCLSVQEVRRIVTFLANTEMTISEIAQRMTCNRGTIAAINQKFQVRKYAGPKSRWILADNMVKTFRVKDPSCLDRVETEEDFPLLSSGG
jgi:hypothetical protein